MLNKTQSTIKGKINIDIEINPKTTLISESGEIGKIRLSWKQSIYLNFRKFNVTSERLALIFLIVNLTYRLFYSGS